MKPEETIDIGTVSGSDVAEMDSDVSAQPNGHRDNGTSIT
jgi:hypothetical protein